MLYVVYLLTLRAQFVVRIATSNDLTTPVELRIEDLRHHIHVESAVEAGARNAVKLLQNTRTPDKKALAEVIYFCILPLHKGCLFLSSTSQEIGSAEHL